MFLRIQILRIFDVFSCLSFSLVFLKPLSAGTTLSWGLLPILLPFWPFMGDSLSHSLAAVLSQFVAPRFLLSLMAIFREEIVPR